VDVRGQGECQTEVSYDPRGEIHHLDLLVRQVKLEESDPMSEKKKQQQSKDRTKNQGQPTC
jgi:hypothetical protein